MGHSSVGTGRPIPAGLRLRTAERRERRERSAGAKRRSRGDRPPGYRRAGAGQAQGASASRPTSIRLSTRRPAKRDRRRAAAGGAPSTAAPARWRRDSCRPPASRPTRRRGSRPRRSRTRRCAPARRRSRQYRLRASCAAPSASRSRAAPSSPGSCPLPCRARWRPPRPLCAPARCAAAPPARQRTWPPGKGLRTTGTSTGRRRPARPAARNC